MGRILVKSFSRPDEVRPYERGQGELVRIGTNSLGRANLAPGWRWSTHMKPIMGTPSCPVHHLQLILSGRFAVRLDDGEEVELGPDDVADIPAGHDAWVVGDEPCVLLDFAGNIDLIGLPREHQRITATLLMSDIVGSTAIAARLGDHAWKQLLADHNQVTRRQVWRFEGIERNDTGDGIFASFATAAAALRCAQAINEGLVPLEIGVRTGVHTGEIEISSEGAKGIAINTTSRIMALGGPTDILVSSLTVALAEGSGLRFEPLGSHELKGIDRPMEIFRLSPD